MATKAPYFSQHHDARKLQIADTLGELRDLITYLVAADGGCSINGEAGDGGVPYNTEDVIALTVGYLTQLRAAGTLTATPERHFSQHFKQGYLACARDAMSCIYDVDGSRRISTGQRNKIVSEIKESTENVCRMKPSTLHKKLYDFHEL